MVLQETMDPRQTQPCPENFIAYPARPLMQVTAPANAQVWLGKEPQSLVAEHSRWSVEEMLLWGCNDGKSSWRMWEKRGKGPAQAQALQQGPEMGSEAGVQ